MKKILIEPFLFLKKYLIPILIFTIYCLTMYFLKLDSCLSKLIFGIPCPGCGMTRAVINLITLHPYKALMFNPFVYVLPFFILVVIYKEYKYINPIFKSRWYWAFISLFLVISYVIRMILLYPAPPLDINHHSLIHYMLELYKLIIKNLHTIYKGV